MSTPDEESFPVVVVDVESAGPGEQLRIVQRFANVTQAEDFIGTLPDTDKVARGGYGIDAPEEF